MTNLELVEVSGDMPDDGHWFHIVDRAVKDRTLVVASFLERGDAELFLRAKGTHEPRDEPQDFFQQYLDEWAKAYPLDVFPLPDFARVAEVLKAAGLSLDCVSA